MNSLVWYVAYGSNMSSARFACYLEGGCPPGSRHAHPGARDPSPPRAVLPVTLPGTVFFAGDSPLWGGGRAYYDPEVVGRTPARAYLITTEQFADLRDQEPPVYDRLLEVGVHDGVRMLTFTTSLSKVTVPQTEPAPAYLATIAEGLAEAHGWDEPAIAEYLADLRC